jgi:hypothetical protein
MQPREAAKRQRNSLDIHPLEEALGFRSLPNLNDPNYTTASIGSERPDRITTMAPDGHRLAHVETLKLQVASLWCRPRKAKRRETAELDCFTDSMILLFSRIKVLSSSLRLAASGHESWRRGALNRFSTTS